MVQRHPENLAFSLRPLDLVLDVSRKHLLLLGREDREVLLDDVARLSNHIRRPPHRVAHRTHDEYEELLVVERDAHPPNSSCSIMK